MDLLHSVLHDANLFAAWEKVEANKGGAGTDGQGVDEFALNVFGRLQTLKEQVLRLQYKPQPLLEFEIEKPSGGWRRLAVPAVRDRVLQTAVALVLAPILDREFEEQSFAYRMGRSVPMAVARVAWYRDKGYRWVVDADIQGFFDNIDHELMLSALHANLPDDSLLPLIRLWLSGVVQPATGQPYLLTRGVPQGSPLSPLLANLYLDDFDEALVDKDLCFVRFADDFLILCRNQDAAEQAMELSNEVLDGLKLAMKPEKTRITHFDEGFRFLGVDFVRNLMIPADSNAGKWLLPSEEQLAEAGPVEEIALDEDLVAALRQAEDDLQDAEISGQIVNEVLESARLPLLEEPDHDWQDADLYGKPFFIEGNPALEPLLRSLFVTEQGLSLRKESERLLVTDGREVLASIPLYKLDQVVAQGNQMVSTALLRFAAKERIQVHFLDIAGRYQGSFMPAGNINLELERQQYRKDDDKAFKLMAAQAFVSAKIHNCRLVLRRFNRRRDIQGVVEREQAMGKLEKRLIDCHDLDKLRGIEGAAAGVYFRALALLLPEHWQFSVRDRKPPADPFNLLLSYGYGVLFHNMHTLVRRRGLSPWLGALHASDGRHPALVSDLVEEFRAIVVDSVALHALINLFKPEDFILNPDDPFPCQLTDDARKRYLKLLQEKFRSPVLHQPSGRRLDYHRLMQHQAWHYAQVMLGEQKVYNPHKAR